MGTGGGPDAWGQIPTPNPDKAHPGEAPMPRADRGHREAAGHRRAAADPSGVAVVFDVETPGDASLLLQQPPV